jgi:hypothetical protein
MLVEGTIVRNNRPSVASMNLWKRVKENIPDIICPCKIPYGSQLVVLESFLNGALLCRIGNSTSCTVFLERDVRQLGG